MGWVAARGPPNFRAGPVSGQTWHGDPSKQARLEICCRTHLFRDLCQVQAPSFSSNLPGPLKRALQNVWFLIVGSWPLGLRGPPGGPQVHTSGFGGPPGSRKPPGYTTYQTKKLMCQKDSIEQSNQHGSLTDKRSKTWSRHTHATT